MVEDQHTAVAKRLDHRHVAAVEMPSNGRPVAATKQVQLGVSARAEPRTGFHERSAAVDVEQQHRLPWPEYRMRIPT